MSRNGIVSNSRHSDLSQVKLTSSTIPIHGRSRPAEQLNLPQWNGAVISAAKCQNYLTVSESFRCDHSVRAVAKITFEICLQEIFQIKKKSDIIKIELFHFLQVQSQLVIVPKVHITQIICWICFPVLVVDQRPYSSISLFLQTLRLFGSFMYRISSWITGDLSACT